MNKRERVLTALEGGTPDYVPVGFWHHFPPEKSLGQACIDAHLDYYEKTGQDLIKIMCDGYFGYPNPLLKTLSETKQLYDIKPLGPDHPFIVEQVERAAAIVRAKGEECCVFYSVFCPLSYLRLEVDWDKMMEWMRADPKAVVHACSVIAEDAKTLVRLLIEQAGCDGIYYCVQNAETYRFTEEEYRAWVTPSDKAVLDYANKLSRHNIIHFCGWGGDKNRLEVWQDYQAAAVNWAVYVEELSIPDGRRYFDAPCVLGGFDNRRQGLLFSGGKDEIQTFTRELIEQNGKAGLILGADCTLPEDIDLAHVAWVVEQVSQL